MTVFTWRDLYDGTCQNTQTEKLAENPDLVLSWSLYACTNNTGNNFQITQRIKSAKLQSYTHKVACSSSS